MQAGQSLNNFHYVYILVREMDETRHDTGITDDPDSKLKAHNSGQVSHTSKYLLWRIENAIAFNCREKAADFEKYLKSRLTAYNHHQSPHPSKYKPCKLALYITFSNEPRTVDFGRYLKSRSGLTY